MGSEKNINPRIGVIAVGRSTFDVEFAKNIFNQAWANLLKQPLIIIGKNEICFDSEIAIKTFAEINLQNIDMLLIIQATFTDASVISQIAQGLTIPLVVWTFPEERTGGRLRLNSFCGVNLASHSLTRIQKSLTNVHGAPDNQKCIKEIIQLAKAASVINKLRLAKILVVGDHPIGFDACNYSDSALKNRFGVSVNTTAISEFLDSVKELPESAADEAYARRAKDFANLGDMDEVATRKTLKVYHKLKSRATTESFDGVAVRCWPEFFTDFGCAACGALALLNEDRIPSGCEADMFGVISSLILQWSSENSVFNTDLVDIDPTSDTVVFWHCGQAPIDMADPEVKPIATIHTNRKLPLLSQFPLKPGRITMCRITQGEGKLRMMVGGGEMLKAPLAYAGTSGVAKLDVSADIFRQKLLTLGLEHHCSITYGDHREILKTIAKFLNLEVVELT